MTFSKIDIAFPRTYCHYGDYYFICKSISRKGRGFIESLDLDLNGLTWIFLVRVSSDLKLVG